MPKEKPERKIEYAEDIVNVDKLREEVEEEEELEEETESQDNTLPVDRKNGQHEMTDAELNSFERRELAKHIPGYGHLFHVDEEFLPESGRLSKQAIFGFAARDMQQGVLDTKRTQSAWDIFKNKFMRYTIAEDGKGRDESITLHHLVTDEKEAAAGGGLHD